MSRNRDEVLEEDEAAPDPPVVARGGGRLSALGALVFIAGAVSEVTGIIPVLAGLSVLAVAATGIVIRKLSRRHARRPRNSSPAEPVRTITHSSAQVADDGYETT